MTDDETYIKRCLELAKQAFGNTYPNPMVGCVIVHNGAIIGEGFHHKAGEPHAEVNAIQSVANQELLQESTLYVSLEPCAHFGKTPPCADLIVAKKIKRVVVGCIDTFSKVSGKGIEKLKQAGIDVTTNVLEQKSRNLNCRFFTYHEKKRPYIILKWAQTKDGFIDELPEKKSTTKGVRITNEVCEKLVHQWRTEEQAILVGTNTAVNDNPNLTARLVIGNNPLRVVWDLHNRIPENNNVKNGKVPTIIFSLSSGESTHNIEYKEITNENKLLQETLDYLYEKGIQSLIVEGGSQTLQTFIDANCWDEARIFSTNDSFGQGICAPILSCQPSNYQVIGNATLYYYFK